MRGGAGRAPSGSSRGLEVAQEPSGHGIDLRRRRIHRCGVALEEQVVGQRHAVPGGDRSYLVAAIGVEGDEGKGLLGRSIGRRHAGVAHDQSAALERGRQGHDKGPDHRIGLLRVLMGDEELPGAVDQHRVQLGFQPAARGQAQVGPEAVEGRHEGLGPAPLVELHPADGDLPGIAHPGVEQRLVPESVRCGPAHSAELVCLLGRHGKKDPPDASHVELEIIHRGSPPSAECTRRGHLAQQSGEHVVGSRHGPIASTCSRACWLAHDGIIAGGPGRHLSPPIAAWRTLGRERRRLERRGRTATLWRSGGAIRHLRQPDRCRARGGGTAPRPRRQPMPNDAEAHRGTGPPRSTARSRRRRAGRHSLRRLGSP